MEKPYLNLLRLFHEQGVEYLVVGGYAVIAHGFPRTTAGIDLWIRSTADNARRVVRALERLGYTDGEFEEADFTTVPNFLAFASEGAWIDLLTEVPGVSFAEAYAEALLVEFGQVPVHYLGLAALRAAKKAVGRPQDLRDLDNLPLPPNP